MRLRTPFASILLGALLATLGACQFTTDVLDERRCDSDDDCTGNFRCIEGVCQGLLNEEEQDQASDTGEVDTPPEPCQDFDEDFVFAGVDCEAEVIDCNDYDAAVFPDNDEICDGKDNDCDLEIDDDDDDYVADPCPLGEGVCEGSRRECANGSPVECTYDNYGEYFEADSEESCDGRDNDCDGTVDEGIGRDCYSLGLDHATLTVDGAPCAIGTEFCLEGGEGAYSGVCEDEVTPVDEGDEGDFDVRCDDIDNDCDGDVDPACTCQPGQRRECYSQPDRTPTEHPPCRLGYRECGEDARFETTCHDDVLPEDETCTNPGVDDDCDGVVDNILTLGVSCKDNDLHGECVDGTVFCVGDTLTCVPDRQPVDESCMTTGSDTGDDDCDGFIDNIVGLNEPCIVTSFASNPIWGVCQGGTWSCHDDELVCVPGATSGEVCNDEDDNCDNAVDNDVDTTEDQSHCGACDNACPDGADTSAADCCDSHCVDKGDDPLHCGACGNICPDGADPGATTCCGAAGGACINVTTNAAHCGGCDEQCPHDNGADPDDPAAATTCCPVQLPDGSVIGDCVDVDTDEAHCGACGDPCAATQHCCGGVCVPLDDDDHCQTCNNGCGSGECCAVGESYSCQDIAVDGNCGGCGVTCSAVSLLCCAPPASTLGACVDTVGDIDNCGGCNVACTAGTEPACCETDGGTGACTDLYQDDSDNCGVCGRDCGDDTPDCCGGECTNFLTDRLNCNACGSPCVGATEFCCNGACVDFETSEDHCGRCGNNCEVGEECCDGFCLDSCGGG